MSIHHNSLAAYEAGKRDMFSVRQLQILDTLRAKSGHAGNASQTDREIMTALEYSDMNAVRPRITELVKMGVLVEVGDIQCPVTLKWVRCVALNRPVGQQEFAL